ncbi:MAG TPA: ABC transporter permease subunit [Actinomycetes bacterium]|nr:ABC transporter permease subunit [Actinomycetes bacterium]
MNSGFARVARAEWTKVRSVPSTTWSVSALIGLTVLLSFFVAASVGISGGAPGCRPGAAGCGDEDVVMNGLSGVLFGQFAVVAIATLAATGEYATGTMRSTLTTVPKRSTVLAAKASVVGVLCLAAGLVASLAAFLVSQPVLHGNGFVPEQGYPIVSLADEPALRAVVGSGLYLALVGLLSLGVGMIVRHTAAAITIMFGLLLVPFIAALLLPEHPRELVQKYSPMTAGLAIQRTVERIDSVPIGVWAGLGVLAGWAVAALLGGFVMINRRDA